MTTLVNDVPISIRYFQDETDKLHKRTKAILPEDERIWFYQRIADLINSAKARGSNPNDPLFTDGRSITGLNVRERFIAFRNPAKGAFRKQILDLTTMVSDVSLEHLWTVLEMIQEKNRGVFAQKIISLVEQSYAWGEKSEPHKDRGTILSEISTW